MLVDVAVNHAILTIMDEHFGYNHIFVDKEDTHKTMFKFALVIYEWIFMPFWTKVRWYYLPKGHAYHLP